jgi:hypothetical protein
MDVHVVDAAVPVPRASRAPVVVLTLAGIASVIFVGGFALPYFLSSSYGPAVYAPKRGWLLLHIGGGIVALLTGPIQMWLGLANRALGWHKRLGMLYMSAVCASSIAAFYLATHTDFGWVFGAGLFGLAVAWVSTTGLAFLAIKRWQIDQHKEWTIRSYVVTFAFVNFRIVGGTLQAANVGTLQEQLAVASWTCWAVPLLIAELVIQGRKILR